METSNELPLHLQVPNSAWTLQMGLCRILSIRTEWLPAYDLIAEWMSDNQGKGLLLTGGCGLGKSTIARRILPVVIDFHLHRNLLVVDAYDMNSRIDELKKRELLCIDDLGVEGEYVEFGNRRIAFNEIVDAAEKGKHFLVVTTNLSSQEIVRKYGERTLDRIRATMRCIRLEGASMRK